MEEENNEEMVDVNVWEFSLDEEEIDEMIEKLKQLKNTKTNFSFDVDEENELLVNYQDLEDESIEEDEE